MRPRYLLDTGPAFDCMFRRRGVDVKVSEALLRGARVGICTPVLGEIIHGIEGSASREATWEVVRRSIGKLILWPYDKTAAHAFGRIFAELERGGRPM